MAKNDKNKPGNFERLLEDEGSGPGGIAYAGEDITQVDDEYVKKLRDKMEEDDGKPKDSSTYSQVKHRFVAHGGKDGKGRSGESPEGKLQEGEQEDGEGFEAALADRMTAPRPALAFTDKTTQKLLEDIKKSSSDICDDSSAPVKKEPAKWRGNAMYVLCGPDAGRSFYVSGSRINVGRGLENDVVLKDISVSRKHCLICREDDGWFVQDLGSDNGTYVDGKPVKKLRIKPGQYVQIGRTIIVLETS
ncbi:MAG: FHA domain-containing protein [Pseudomonadota bacterium]